MFITIVFLYKIPYLGGAYNINLQHTARLYALCMSLLGAQTGINGSILTSKHRGVEQGTAIVGGVIGAGILLVIFLIIMGNLLPTGLGSLANGSTGTKMLNVDSGTKGLYSNINLLTVVVIIVLIVVIALRALHKI